MLFSNLCSFIFRRKASSCYCLLSTPSTAIFKQLIRRALEMDVEEQNIEDLFEGKLPVPNGTLYKNSQLKN